jgi:DUF4097 and DUF4098 domain-containing protein YvlB
MKAPISAAVLAMSVTTTGCTVTVDSHSEVAREEKRFTVTGVAELRLTTFDGSIQIQAWDKPEILVEIEKRGPTKESLNEVTVTADQKGNRIELEAKRPRKESITVGFRRSPSASLIVSVPRETNIVARSGDGSIKIERVNGRIELRTGDGSITAREVSGELLFDTSDGSVRVDRAQGRLSVDTGDGSVDVDGEITTGDGSVSLYIPAGFNAEIDAHTGDGSIRSDLEGLPSPNREDSRRTLRGKVGEGGKLLRIRTGDGAIRLGTS